MLPQNSVARRRDIFTAQVRDCRERVVRDLGHGIGLRMIKVACGRRTSEWSVHQLTPGFCGHYARHGNARRQFLLFCARLPRHHPGAGGPCAPLGARNPIPLGVRENTQTHLRPRASPFPDALRQKTNRLTCIGDDIGQAATGRRRFLVKFCARATPRPLMPHGYAPNPDESRAIGPRTMRCWIFFDKFEGYHAPGLKTV